MADEPGKLDISDEMIAERRGGSGKMPEEMPLSFSENVAYRNHLIHRQDNTLGNTILHRLVEEGTNKQLQSFLDAAKEVYPIANRDHQTPLHLAIKRSDHAKAEMLFLS